MKKALLRNIEVYRQKKRIIRRTIIIALPSLMLLGFLTWTFGRTTDFDNHIIALKDESSLIEIHNSFHNKFYSMSLPLLSETPVQPTEIAQLESISEYENIDFVSENSEYIFVLTDSGLEIIQKSSNNLTHYKKLSHSAAACDAEMIRPEGLFSNETHLVIVGSKTTGLCDNPDTPYYLRNHQVEIITYDITNEFKVIDTYTVSGAIVQMRQDEMKLMVSLNTYLPFEFGFQTLETFLPYIVHNGIRTTTQFDQIKYIEGNIPNNFTALVHIDIMNATADQEVLFLDYHHNVTLLPDAAFYISDSYEFIQVSDPIRFKDPVESVRTTITKINVGDDVSFYRTQMLEGVKVEGTPVHVHQNDLIILNKSSEQTNRYYLHTIDNQLSTIETYRTVIDYNIRAVLFYRQYMYVIPTQPNIEISIYNFSQRESVFKQAQIDHLLIPEYVREYSDQYIIGANNLTNNMIQIKLIDRTLAFRPSIESTRILDYQHYDFLLNAHKNPLQDSYFNADLKLVAFPLFSAGNLTANRNTPNTIIFRVDDLNWNIQTIIHVPILEASQSPFAYRATIYKGQLVHITPAGLVLTTIDQLDEIISTIEFQ